MMVEGSGPVHEFCHFRYANYSRILTSMRRDFEARSKPDVLYVPYVLLCAAALEAMLNDQLYDFAYIKYRERYRPIWKRYRSMSFRAKLESIVSILTNGQFVAREEHVMWTRLAVLINERNRLVHPVPAMHKLRREDLDTRRGLIGVHGPSDAFMDSVVYDLTIGAKAECLPTEYHDAIVELHEALFANCPDELDAMDLVIRRNDG